MVRSIKEAFQTNLQSLKWMDEETKARASNKVGSQAPPLLSELHLLSLAG